MVEVFKTDVTNEVQAINVVGIIERYFEGCKANFDLGDCDHILRVEVTDTIDADAVVNLLKEMRVSAEVLPDVVEGIDFLLPASRLIIR